MLERSSPVAVEIVNVTKRLGSQVVIDDLSLSVRVGQICGIQGHNGAGKSILLRIICGLVVPNSGSVRVFGQHIGVDVEFPPQVGALIDAPGFLPNHSGRRNLQLLAMIRRQIDERAIDVVLERVGISPSDGRKTVKTYSTGMRQRLGLAQAIMEDPRLLLLDEPTSGLDPAGVQMVHQLLKELQHKGVTTLLTSHSHEDIVGLCDQVAVMNRGRLSMVSQARSNSGEALSG